MKFNHRGLKMLLGDLVHITLNPKIYRNMSNTGSYNRHSWDFFFILSQEIVIVRNTKTESLE